MSRLTLFVASLVALCLVPLTVRAQEKLDVTAIAPWVDFGAYTVMRFDIERIDPAAVVNLSKAILEKVRQLDEITRSVGGDPRPGPESAPWADSFAAMRHRHSALRR